MWTANYTPGILIVSHRVLPVNEQAVIPSCFHILRRPLERGAPVPPYHLLYIKYSAIKVWLNENTAARTTTNSYVKLMLNFQGNIRLEF